MVASWPLIGLLSFVVVAMENVECVLNECGSWIWMWLVKVHWWEWQERLNSGGVQVYVEAIDLGLAICLSWC